MEITREEWDARASAQEHAEFLQSHAWGEFQRVLGRDIIRVWEAQFFFSAIRMKLPLGLSYLYVPRGPVCTGGDTGAWYQALWNMAQEKRAAFIRFEPIFLGTDDMQKKWMHILKELETVAGKGRVKEVIPIQPKTIWIVDLSKNIEELLAGMHTKTRYNIRLAERKGVAIFRADTKEAHKTACEVFLRLAHTTAQRHEFRLHSDGYYRTMTRVLGEEGQFFIYTARYKGKDITAGLVMTYGDTAAYLHSGSDDAYREVMAPHLLHWKIIQDMKARGIRWYDMGGIHESAAPHHPWAGITRFKQGFGGTMRQYSGTYDLIFSKPCYILYEWLRKIRRRTLPI